MEIREHLSKMQKIEEIFIEYLDNERSSRKDSIFSFNYFEGLNFENKKYKLKEILHLIVQISNHHHRSPNFYQKIYTILIHFKDDIKQSYSNYEIFTIFSDNKCLLSFLFKEQIILFDQHLFERYKNDESYLFYFTPEIVSIDDENSAKAQLFESNREKGENESILCQIIRKDSIEEFIEYVNRNGLSLTDTLIQPSIFETNQFLIGKKVTMIEYAAFFGSIRIITYLYSNKVKLTPSLWIYSIHGNSIELIQFLINNHIKPEDKSYQKCFEESIKCHHNYITNYIQFNLMKKNKTDFTNLIPYYNYAYFQGDCIKYMNHFIEYDYTELVAILLRYTDIDLNSKKILISFFFNKISLIFFLIKFQLFRCLISFQINLLNNILFF